jgi:hypothetical protein
VTPAAGILGRTDFGGAQTTVVNDALRRVRNTGSCAPKKKGAFKIPSPPPPVPPVSGLNTLRMTVLAVLQPGQTGPGAYTVTLTSDETNSLITGLDGFDISNVQILNLIIPYFNPPGIFFFSATETNDGLLIPDLGSAVLSVNIAFETQNLSSSLVLLNTGDLVTFVDGPYLRFITESPILCPYLNITVPIDAIQQDETCSASLRQYYFDGSTHFYYYTPAIELTSYPTQVNAIVSSIVC